MRRIPYGWALAAAVCLAAASELVVPVVPAMLLAVLLTLLVAQVPLPARREGPRTQRPPRSELDRHLERRARHARRARRGEAD